MVFSGSHPSFPLLAGLGQTSDTSVRWRLFLVTLALISLLLTLDLTSSPRSGSGSKRYYTFARVSGGLDTKQRETLQKKLEKKWIRPEDRYSTPLPPWLKPWKAKKEDVPSYWIKPEDSVVFEVGTGLRVSPQSG